MGTLRVHPEAAREAERSRKNEERGELQRCPHCLQHFRKDGEASLSYDEERGEIDRAASTGPGRAKRRAEKGAEGGSFESYLAQRRARGVR